MLPGSLTLLAILLIYSVGVTLSCSSKFFSVAEEPDGIPIFHNLTHVIFKSSNKTAEKVRKTSYNFNKADFHLIQNHKTYIEGKVTGLLQGSSFSNRSIKSSEGFVHTVLNCYRDHHNLVLRPDDIWTAIMVQFSLYVNKNAEQLRNKFVDFEGKKELKVKLDSYTSFDILIQRMTDLINKTLVDNQVADWVLPNFSTTTQDDIITNGVVLMGVLQKYFDCTGTITCGIPEITLLGTLEDWKDISTRVEKLKDYGLEKWVKLLKPVLNEFVLVKEGEINYEFWEQISKMKTVENHICGYPPTSTYLDGWLSVFSVFDTDGNWQGGLSDGAKWPRIDVDNIPGGVITVPLLIDDNGLLRNSLMFAGHMGQEVLSDGVTLAPLSGWAIALKQQAWYSDD